MTRFLNGETIHVAPLRDDTFVNLLASEQGVVFDRIVHSYSALKASHNDYAAIRLRGEARTGKSRILDEFLSVAAHRNHLLGGSCRVLVVTPV